MTYGGGKLNPVGSCGHTPERLEAKMQEHRERERVVCNDFEVVAEFLHLHKASMYIHVCLDNLLCRALDSIGRR